MSSTVDWVAAGKLLPPTTFSIIIFLFYRTFFFALLLPPSTFFFSLLHCETINCRFFDSSYSFIFPFFLIIIFFPVEIQFLILQKSSTGVIIFNCKISHLFCFLKKNEQYPCVRVQRLFPLCFSLFNL